MAPRGSHKNNKKIYKSKKSHNRNNFKRTKLTQKFKNKLEKADFNENHHKLNNLIDEKKVISSSDSEEEVENNLKQFLNTFDSSISNKKKSIMTAIETDESDDDDDDDDDDDNDNNDNIDENNDNIDDNKFSSDTMIENETSNIAFVNENEENFEDNDEDLLKGENVNVSVANNDPFVQHLSYDLHENLVNSLQISHQKQIYNIEWPWLGKLLVVLPDCDKISTEVENLKFILGENKMYAPLGKIPVRITLKEKNFNDLHIKSQIHNNIKNANKELDMDEMSFLTEFQFELFSIINNYQDFYYNERTFENAEEIRFVYCLHAINHILKTRIKILHHNDRLQTKDDVPNEFRDQGLVRPKVLIIVPFRDSALKIVQILIDILVPAQAGQVINKIRFMEDFSGNELILPKKNPKPEDYELTFTGNCDDTFKIGIQVTKKSLKLYADFYSSDIIIASPLGLRLTIGAKGESERDHDFLASIELLIMDQTELFLMQNWDHLIHVLDHLHIQPKQSHDTDFSRVRTWALNGWTHYYRQTLIFSSLQLPEINAIFNRKCTNYAGCVRTVNTIENGSIINVHVQLPQVFKRFHSDTITKSIEARFEYFTSKILSQFKDTIMKQCLIYIPSYFDYVKIRNYFKREDIGFVQICEYSKDAKIARARDMFFHGDAHFLLYSERFHYFRRVRVKGIRHIIFYQPPTFPHFYSELCNFMQESNQNKKLGNASNMTVTVIYSKYDYQRMIPILGTERLSKMASSSNHFHMFTSSDS